MKKRSAGKGKDRRKTSRQNRKKSRKNTRGLAPFGASDLWVPVYGQKVDLPFPLNDLTAT